MISLFLRHYLQFITACVLTICLPAETVQAQVITIPFSTGFETGSSGFTDSLVSGSAWQLGAPAYGVTTGARSGQFAWDVELAMPYQNNSAAYLITPFFNLGGTSNAMLSFWQNRNTETGWDGTRMEYSADGITWNVLGGWLDPNGMNWYTSGSINSSGLPAWEGSSGGWVQSVYKLGVLGITGNIRFRFVFTSDTNVGYDGMSIDDFSLYLLPPYDAGVSNLPDLAFRQAGSNVPPFAITVKNYGAQAFSSFSVSYQINNGVPVTVPSTFNLLPGNVVNLAVPGFTVPNGSYRICAFTSLANDTSHFNDTICLDAVGWTQASLPYFNNFDSGAAGWSPVNPGGGNAWEQGMPNFGSTNSAHSGNTCWDINLNSGYTPASACYLYSPVFDFTGIYNSSLNLYRNQNTSSYAGTCIRYSTNAGNTWTSLGLLQDPSGTNWYNGFLGGSGWTPGWTGNTGAWFPGSLSLGPLDNTDSVMFCFEFSSDTSSGTGFSLDDFGITVPSQVDAGISYIQLPSFYEAGTLVPSLDVVVVNYAAQTLDSVTVTYTINGGPPVTGTYSIGLAPGLGAMLSLPGYPVPPGPYTICAFTSMTADGNHQNDSICQPAYGLPLTGLPFSDHFDNGNTGWATQSLMNPADQWELGIPVTGIPAAAFSAPACWDLNLNNTYTGPSLCYLYSPVFDYSNAVQPVLSFMQNRNTESYWDGVRIEYNINGGNWNLLGGYMDPNGVNWYNTQYINSSNFPGWSGNSNGWVSAEYDLSAVNIPNGAHVGFRFVFNADNVGIYDGMAIDNFNFRILLARDAALSGLVSPSGSAPSGTATPVQVTLKNEGVTSLTALDFYYEFNGALSGPFPWSGNLPTDSSELVTLPSLVPVPGPNSLHVYLSYTTDLNHFNDTLHHAFTGILTVPVPYFSDFENGATGWDVYAHPLAHTSWELGLPAFGSTTGAYSGAFCWDVNLDTACGNLANTILYTPVFDFSTAGNSHLSLAINYDTEPFADGCRMEYTTNGTIWQNLGTLNDPAGTNWYNTTLTSGDPGWSIVSGGWKTAGFPTGFLDGLTYVRFRFVFTSDFVFNSAGFSMDDFNISNSAGMNENTVSGLQVYPSPATDMIFIRLPDNWKQVDGISLKDVTGREVHPDIDRAGNDRSCRLFIEHLSPGPYLVEIRGSGQTVHKWLMKN